MAHPFLRNRANASDGKRVAPTTKTMRDELLDEVTREAPTRLFGHPRGPWGACELPGDARGNTRKSQTGRRGFTSIFEARGARLLLDFVRRAEARFAPPRAI